MVSLVKNSTKKGAKIQNEYMFLLRCITAISSIQNLYFSDRKKNEISRLMHTVAIWTFTFHKKIRHCNSDFEDKVQTSVHCTGQYYEHFDLKIQLYCTHFSSSLCRNCQIHCFLHTVAAISKS